MHCIGKVKHRNWLSDATVSTWVYTAVPVWVSWMHMGGFWARFGVPVFWFFTSLYSNPITYSCKSLRVPAVSSSPLQFWRGNSTEFLIVSRVARSAQSKRDFSSVGLTHPYRYLVCRPQRLRRSNWCDGDCAEDWWTVEQFLIFVIIICNCVAGLQLTALLCWNDYVIQYSISVPVRSNVSGCVGWVRVSEWWVGWRKEDPRPSLVHTADKDKTRQDIFVLSVSAVLNRHVIASEATRCDTCRKNVDLKLGIGELRSGLSHVEYGPMLKRKTSDPVCHGNTLLRIAFGK